jgi:phosphoserine phosphatase RsbU/P
MKKILIIEDDAVLLEGLKESLTNELYDVITATDGENGLNLANKINPDLLVLDINLPSKDGFEICRTLKNDGKIFPIFLLTSLSDATNKLHGLDIGADDYIPKPFNIHELLYRIRNALKHSDKIKQKEKEYESELLKAQKIQLDSLPHTKPVVPGIDVEGKTIPSQFVGGDYFDYIYLKDGRFGIIVADVSGKGMSAALTVNKMQGILQVIEKKINSAEELLLNFQEYLVPKLDSSLFVTAVTALFDIPNKKVQIARAGHLPVLLKRSNTIKKIEPAGLFIGEFAGKFFKTYLKQEELNIENGDSFLLCTDGIIECRNINNEEYGLEKLSKFFSDSELTASDFLMSCFSEIENYTGSVIQKDDITLVMASIEFN